MEIKIEHAGTKGNGETRIAFPEAKTDNSETRKVGKTMNFNQTKTTDIARNKNGGKKMEMTKKKQHR